MTRALLIAAALAASLLAGCGEDLDGSGGEGRAQGPDAKTKKAMLAFAQCMREHGVDMPDPKFGDGERGVMRAKVDGPQEKMRAAERACDKYRKDIKTPELSAEQRAEFKKAALANAKCLREHGIDAPDPVFGDDGSVQMRIGGPGHKRPDEDTLREAQKACRSTMPEIAGSKP